MAELLAVRGLRVDFATDRGPAQVLDGINLDIATGEVVGLVGESGCGKTTLARAILGILPEGAARIRGGEVRFQGTDLLRQDPATVNEHVRGRAITFIPQDPFTSFSPLFPIGTQIMDLMKWKSPRARDGAGPSSIFGRYPRERHRADREAVLDTLRAVLRVSASSPASVTATGLAEEPLSVGVVAATVFGDSSTTRLLP